MATVNSLLLLLIALAISTKHSDASAIAIPPPVERNDILDSESEKTENPVCPTNEYYNECEALCQADCTNYGKPIACPDSCHGGCVCKPPLVRGPDGVCIPPAECPAAKSGGRKIQPCFPEIPPTGGRHCGPNEHYERCGPVCRESCFEYTCPLHCCVEDCFCDEGYVKGCNGTCIKKDECFALSDHSQSNEIEGSTYFNTEKCGPDEHISCSSHCQRNCSNFKDVLKCTSECSLGCVCTLPKIRGPDGNCILPQQCPQVSQISTDSDTSNISMCRPDEFLGCSAHCQLDCSNYKEGRECTKECVEGCVCVPPKIRGPYGSCILPEKCASPSLTRLDSKERAENLCGPDENLSWQSHCEKDCTNFQDEMIPCHLIKLLGCACKQPKIRGPDGTCILQEQCPASLLKRQGSGTPPVKICGPDEMLSWQSHCQKDCTNYQEEMIPCPLIKLLGCACIPPKIKGPNGNCILPEQCPAPPQGEENSLSSEVKICRPDEILSWESHCQRDCTNLQEESIPCPLIKILGCVCKLPKIRGPDGSCIYPHQCPVSSLSRQEENMKEMALLCDFLRLNENPLKWSKVCPKIAAPICPENEHYDLGFAHCEKTCKTYDRNMPCPRICVEGCVCNPPLVRGPSGKCVDIAECPERNGTLLCPENEEWEYCGTSCPKNCNDYDKDKSCDRRCNQGCFCKEPRVRGPEGKCVLIEECPPRPDEETECPENEQWDVCGTACPKNCTNYNEDIYCILRCERGCFCKEPRVRGPDGSCILVEECPETKRPICNVNEYYDECTAHCQANCTNYDKPIPCPYICVGGCVCKPPLVRQPDGSCIPTAECPTLVSVEISAKPVCPENEYYDECDANCQKDCDNPDGPRICPLMCEAGCICKAPLVRGPDGRCINVEECAKTEETVIERPICNINEYYDECGALCQRNCTNYDKDIYCPLICWGGCLCKPPMVRGPDGTCLFTEQCAAADVVAPSETPDCPANEQYDECYANCQKDCTNYDRPMICPYMCEAGCICKPPMVRGPDGNCIHVEECVVPGMLSPGKWICGTHPHQKIE